MVAANSSVRVSRQTRAEIERLRETFQTDSADETIRKLIRERRSRALSRLIGSGRGVLSKFSEGDRLAPHD